MTSSIAAAPERKAPVGAKEASPFENEDSDSGDYYIDAPSDIDLGEEFGSAMPVRDEDEIPDDGSELPDVEVVKKRISAKTQVLMEELFRTKIVKVQRVNPKKIR